MRVRQLVVGVVAAAVAAWMMAAVPAFAEAAPHVATGTAPDTCAMCHRAHTATAPFGRSAADSWEPTGNALVLAAVDASGTAGDTMLCYACHGVDALGSGTDVQSSFLATSAHDLAPAPAPYGPSVIQCSSCHDSHGSDKAATGVPYPFLLRARTSTGTAFFQGEEYCATCHFQDRPNDVWDGLAIYRQTAHFSALPEPATGTKIRCSNCHMAHGSAIAPLIVSQIASPALPATVTVTANDRTLCFACHPDPSGTYPGQTAYPSSAHGSSSATVAIAGEWPAAGASRLVGECQNCHAPMGSYDGSGTAVPKLLEVEGRTLCDRCHDADGPASADVSATAYPAAAAPHLEVLAGVSPDATGTAYSTLAVVVSEATVAPWPLAGLREFEPAGAVSDVAIGDVDGDGKREAVVGYSDAAVLSILREDALSGLARTDVAIPASAEFVAVADVLGDLDGLPEVLALDADAGVLRVYRWDGSGLGFVTSVSVGLSTSGMATGDVTGGLSDDVIVTDGGADEIRIITETGVDQLQVATTVASAFAAPRGPSVGDVWGGAPGMEIVVANAGETSDTVAVYDGSGDLLGTATVDAELASGSRAWYTLPVELDGASPGVELAVAVNGFDGTSTVNVFRQSGGGLSATPTRFDTGLARATGSLAAGDVDGDGTPELIVGNGGWWASGVGPSAQVFDGVLALAQTLPLGGTERAGSVPLAVGDLGAIGLSRHPVGAVAGSHNSTETAPFARHVECVDCHDPHEATSTVAAAPAVYGALKGVFGVAVTNIGAGSAITYAQAQPIANEYEVCFKCHSGYGGWPGVRDVASEVNTQNVSVHAVEASRLASAPASTFEAGWAPDSVLYCGDCHGTADAGIPAGPHVSSASPLLKRPVFGVTVSDSGMLCYACHKRSIYYTGADDTGTASLFYDAAEGALHARHTLGAGLSCAACHVSHGSPTEDRLTRADVGLTRAPSGGSCVGSCHPGAGASYTRP
ncbi:MAG: cytochrome c3 family protein [Anaerosomatales bacterium]|nr:cytochrome c3 family protein [Anaerosomatales bacterium]